MKIFQTDMILIQDLIHIFWHFVLIQILGLLQIKEVSMDFPNEEIAIEYFKKNPEIFWKIEQDIMKGHSSDGVYLENISTLIPMSDSKTEPKPKRSIENHEDDINR